MDTIDSLLLTRSRAIAQRRDLLALLKDDRATTPTMLQIAEWTIRANAALESNIQY